MKLGILAITAVLATVTTRDIALADDTSKRLVRPLPDANFVIDTSSIAVETGFELGPEWSSGHRIGSRLSSYSEWHRSDGTMVPPLDLDSEMPVRVTYKAVWDRSDPPRDPVTVEIHQVNCLSWKQRTVSYTTDDPKWKPYGGWEPAIGEWGRIPPGVNPASASAHFVCTPAGK